MPQRRLEHAAEPSDPATLEQSQHRTRSSRMGRTRSSRMGLSRVHVTIHRLTLWIRSTGETLLREIAKFGVVGLFALIVDVGLFNLLRFAGGEGPFYDRPLTAKVISVIAATTVAYFGNRFWTFRYRGRPGMGREYLLFFVLNAVGMFIALGCLWFSHYALGLTSPLADNISANVVGLALGTMFRFWSYRRWVFPAIPLTDVVDRPRTT